MISITKEYEIDAAHTLLNHYGPCRYMHGHRYRFQLSLTGTILTDEQVEGVTMAGMLVDFAYLKQAFEATVGKWDHAYLSPLTEQELLRSVGSLDDEVLSVLGLDEPSRVIPFGCNPTAENIAIIACGKILAWLKRKCPVVEDLYSLTVTVYETPTSSAEYTEYFWGKDHDAN